jgi:hypothetical protein
MNDEIAFEKTQNGLPFGQLINSVFISRPRTGAFIEFHSHVKGEESAKS